MKILHFTEQPGLKKDELPVTRVRKQWRRPVRSSTWQLQQEDKDFPKLKEASESLKDGLTAIEVVGGKPGARVELINKVIFNDEKGETANERFWIYVFRNQKEATRLMEKPKKPDPKKAA